MLAANFWNKVEKTESCWVWQAACRAGYGVFGYQGRQWYAHRLLFEMTKGAVPEGLQLDHLCRNRACVNPEHLEIVTPWENTMRGDTPAAKNAAKTTCKRGHPYDRVSKGKRYCTICGKKPFRVSINGKSYDIDDPRANPALRVSARGLNKCIWCGKMASWSALSYGFNPERGEGWYEHTRECP